MTGMIHTIHINFDAKCAECGRGGEVEQTKLCTKCFGKAMNPKSHMKSEIGRQVQALIQKKFISDKKVQP